MRKIINIDESKCNGCGLCVEACHEGAIAVTDGKARLVREDYCDGLGDCLPVCPRGALSFRITDADDADKSRDPHGAFVCPGMKSRKIAREQRKDTNLIVESELRQWPVQIKLAPERADYFDGAELLIAADCTAYAYGNFHSEFIKDRITLIGCPKLDDTDYSEKLSRIIADNNIAGVTVVRMQVPCCKGIEVAVQRAIEAASKRLPCRIVVISTDGKII